jgi:phenylpropionate dioxygenase-like ring-hydroxylating dioxygenase large terminal subunit
MTEAPAALESGPAPPPVPRLVAPKRHADEHTPLIANAWYVVAKSDEISRQLNRRRVLGRDVLLYRKQSGEPVALSNRCAHRSYPLSNGYLDGDELVCGYHGLHYDAKGFCVRVPGRGAPSGVKVSSFKLIERAPLVWIWLGDQSLADEGLISQHHPTEDAGWTAVSGYFHIKSNYVHLHENLHDLTHFSYLHAQTIGTKEFAEIPITVDIQDGEVRTRRELLNHPAPPMWEELMNLRGKRVDRIIEGHYCSPGLHSARLTIRDLSPKANDLEEFHLRILHFISPETQDSTHYWWFIARDFAQTSAEVSGAVEVGISNTFQQDKDALEAISEVKRTDGNTSFREASFLSDRPGMATLRILQRAADAEQPQHADGISRA